MGTSTGSTATTGTKTAAPMGAGAVAGAGAGAGGAYAGQRALTNAPATGTTGYTQTSSLQQYTYEAR